MVGPAIAGRAHRGARPVSHRQPVWAVCSDDRGRYEIEFQGSNDGQNWTPYLFRYKPQALNEAPRIYAPYQPRFEWNLWFASLGEWRQSNFVPLTEERLLENDPEVLALFKNNPFGETPPRYVRAMLWQYLVYFDGGKTAHRKLVEARSAGTICA